MIYRIHGEVIIECKSSEEAKLLCKYANDLDFLDNPYLL